MLTIDLSKPESPRGFPDCGDKPTATLIYGRRGAGKSLLAAALAERGGRVVDEDDANIHNIATLNAALHDGGGALIVTQRPGALEASLSERIDFAVFVRSPADPLRRGREVVAVVHDMRGSKAAIPADGGEPDWMIRYVGLESYWLATPAMVNKLVRMPAGDIAELADLDAETATHHIRRAVREYLDRRSGESE